MQVMAILWTCQYEFFLRDVQGTHNNDFDKEATWECGGFLTIIHLHGFSYKIRDAMMLYWEAPQGTLNAFWTNVWSPRSLSRRFSWGFTLTSALGIFMYVSVPKWWWTWSIYGHAKSCFLALVAYPTLLINRAIILALSIGHNVINGTSAKTAKLYTQHASIIRYKYLNTCLSCLSYNVLTEALIPMEEKVEHSYPFYS